MSQRFVPSVSWIYRKRGLKETTRVLVSAILYRLWLHLTPDGRRELNFDRIHGTDTDGYTEPSEFGLESPNIKHASYYVSSKLRTFEFLVRKLPRIAKDYSFVDVGCGKGRVLIRAIELGFRKIYGVDLSPRLVDIAVRNMERCSHCASIKCQDACDYQFPDDDLVVYMFNPFREAVMQRFIRNLEDFIRRSHRKVYIIYATPFEEHILQGSPLLRKSAGEHNEYCIYESLRA